MGVAGLIRGLEGFTACKPFFEECTCCESLQACLAALLADWVAWQGSLEACRHVPEN